MACFATPLIVMCIFCVVIKPLPRVGLLAGACYTALLTTALFHTTEDLHGALEYIDPALAEFRPVAAGGTGVKGREDAPTYAEDCALTAANVWSNLDLFFVSHSVGWMFIGLWMGSDVGTTFLFAVGWELTETFFVPFDPSLEECWWDQWVLDCCICNVMGILAAAGVWRALGRERRALSEASLKYFLISLFGCTLLQLNAFVLKHSFGVPAKSWLHPFRILIWSALADASQWWQHVKDPRRFGVPVCFMALVVIIVLEACVVAKFGQEFFGGRESEVLRAACGWALSLGLFGTLSFLGLSRLPSKKVVPHKDQKLA